ncbi:MAG: HzsA-related protein [Planctomycetota bacterium]|jgi:hypothetical protein
MTAKAAFGTIVCFALSLLCPSSGRANPRLAFVQAPRSSSQAAAGGIGNTIVAGRYTQGMRVALADLDNVEGSLRVVTEGFVCATDPVFSHDGSRVAFSGRRASDDNLQIWELAGDAAKPARIVACEADCINPVYMPNGDMAFASFLSREYEEHGGRYAASLYALQPGYDQPTRLTFNPSSDFDPVVLPDGRMLYSSWQHVGNHHWPTGTVALMLINSDGTGLFPLTGNHRGPRLKRGSTPLEDDRITFIQSEGFGEFGEGTLVTTSLHDSFAPYETLVSADQYTVSDVSPLGDGKLLLSARPTRGTQSTFGLYVYQGGSVRLLYDDPDYHELAPSVWLSNTLPDVRVSTVVPDTPYGYLTVLDCYDTDRTDQHPLRRGSVKTIRVIEGLPLRHNGPAGPTFFPAEKREGEPLIRPNSATGYIPARILGEIPPAADGSVYMKVPADRPLRLQLVDRDGFTIINERAWFWVRPNERRVCIGCHENRELSPRNAVPLAARRAPTDLTNDSGWQTVTFRQDIQPILTKSCAIKGCHVPPDPTAGMNLTADRLNGDKDALFADRFGPAYANLLARQENKPFAIGGRRVHPGDARSSPLLWMLYGRALAPQYKPAPFERPMISAHPGPMLPEALLELIRKWVDLGAQYDTESPPGPWPYETVRADVATAEGKPDVK